MIADKKKFLAGLGLLIAFIVVQIIIFAPLSKGQNGLEYLDDLYNSISKGSAYYIPKVKAESEKFMGRSVHTTLAMEDDNQARQTSLLFKKSGASVNVSGTRLEVEGDLGKILENCLTDADQMYINDGQAILDKYAFNERQALFNWWNALNLMDKNLKKQKKFSEAEAVSLVAKKAVESSYNYYQIEPQKISDRLGVVIFSLVFYIVYTLWYGFAIMFMFEGWGLRLEH